MKTVIKNIIILASFFGGMFLTSCEENYLKYDTSYSGIYFTKDTLRYSFSVAPEEVKSFLFKIPVQIMGGISKHERQISYIINNDSTNAVEGVHYTIGKAIVKPDSIDGYIPVTILRDSLEGSYPNYKKYTLCIELVSNGNFTPTLDSLSRVRVLRFDNAIDIPAWVDYKGDKIWRPGEPHPQLGEWHPYTYKKLVEQFKTIKDVPNMEETYEKMVAYYGGENLEKVPYASFHPYLPVMRKYVLDPLYKYFSDPANRDIILDMYPDYPFNFPNPYE